MILRYTFYSYSPLKSELSHFDYKWLIEQLERAHLDFGVRQYIPSLCASVIPIPPEAWAKAVFTEGHFKKETREQIFYILSDLYTSIPAAETGLIFSQMMEIPDANAPSEKHWAEHECRSKIISYTPAIKQYRRQQKQRKQQKQKQQKQ